MTRRHLIGGMVSAVAAGVTSTPAARRRRVTTADSRPRLVWTIAGEGRGTPAADDRSVFFLLATRAVVAVEAQTGTLRWSSRTGPPIRRTLGSRVTLVGDVVVAGDEDVIGFDRATGAFRWRFAPGPEHAPGALVGGADSGRVFAGSTTGRLQAIDAASGLPAWTVRVASRTTVFPPVTSSEMVVASFTTFDTPPAGGLVAVERRTGRECWRRAFPVWQTPSFGTGAASEPVVAGDEVIASSQDGTIYAFALASGMLRWIIPGIERRGDGRTAEPQDARPLVRSGTTLLTGSLRGAISAYDLATRRERWRQVPVNASVAFGLAADEDTVFIPYLSGHLVALATDDGRERWRVGGPAEGFSWVPLVHGPNLYAAGSTAGLFAWERHARFGGSL